MPGTVKVDHRLGTTKTDTADLRYRNRFVDSQARRFGDKVIRATGNAAGVHADVEAETRLRVEALETGFPQAGKVFLRFYFLLLRHCFFVTQLSVR